MLIYIQMIESAEECSKFEQLYNKYAGLMYHIAAKYLANEQDREDAVQTAFEAIIRNIKKIPGADCPQTYSYIVNTIESKSIDILRKMRNKTVELDENIPGILVELPEDDALAAALAKLPAHYREIILLRYDCGYTTKELASMLDMTRANVQKQVLRAKKALDNILWEDEKQNEKQHQR